MRTGLWISGAGGSGILVARQADGTWSPPSGILLHTAGLGFLVGVDIYDCVVVINTEEALQAFTKIRCTLGSEISVAAGPVGAGGILDTEIHKRQAPIYTYMKSRGFYAGVQIDGSVIIERFDENERFYNQKLSVQEILTGKVRHPPYEVRKLLETIKAAQGDRDVDESMIPTEAPPGDFEIEDGHTFGVPDKDDPDPYGVLALEKEGMSLKEAGTKKRASWEEFSFKPSPTSPIHDIMARNSDERARSSSQRSSWRASAFGSDVKKSSSLRNSIDQDSPVLVTDSATQIESRPVPKLQKPALPPRQPKIATNHEAVEEKGSTNDEPVVESTPAQREPATATTLNGYTTPPRTPSLHTTDAVAGAEQSDADDEDDEDDHHVVEEPTVFALQTVAPSSPGMVNKPRIVNVPKRVPPKLPARNPNRSGAMPSETELLNQSAETDVVPKEDEHFSVTPHPDEPLADATELAGPDGTVSHKLEEVSLDDSKPLHSEAEPNHMPGGFV